MWPTTFTQKIGFWAKLKTPKTHHSGYQNEKFGVDSASLSKTLRVNQIYFHHKTVSAYHPWLSVFSDPRECSSYGCGGLSVANYF